MTSEPAAFFTLDHGSATTAAALIGRLGGRWRLLTAGAVPAGVPEEILLDDLVRRVRRVDAGALSRALAAGSPTRGDEGADWRGWSRVSCRTSPPPPIVIAAGSERSLAAVEPAFADGGWRIAARLTPDRLDAVAATELLLGDEAATIALAGSPDDGHGIAEIAALVGAAATGRDDVHVLLVGHAAAAIELPAGPRRTRLPAPAGSAEGHAAAAGESLLEAAARVAFETAGFGPGGLPASAVGGAPAAGGATDAHVGDGRSAFRRAVASLAAVLDVLVDGIDIGLDAATRVLAAPDGLERAVVRADAGLFPVARRDPHRRDTVVRDDERAFEAIAGWSPLRDDDETLRDRVRNLRRAPWRDATGDGARLRLAAARAALARVDASWNAGLAGKPSMSSPHPDLVVVSGGCFASAPPPAVALAVIDAIRRPGAIALGLDHARVLAPLGTLADEGDRRRLLADLADDILLPLAGAILAPGLRAGRRAVLRITSDGAASEITLHSGTVQVIDLPPGLVASAEVEAPDEFWIGARARRVGLRVTGGLGGLLVDTRDIPLRLPERTDRRREVLEAWQRPLWTGGDG